MGYEIEDKVLNMKLSILFELWNIWKKFKQEKGQNIKTFFIWAYRQVKQGGGNKTEIKKSNKKVRRFEWHLFDNLKAVTFDWEILSKMRTAILLFDFVVKNRLMILSHKWREKLNVYTPFIYLFKFFTLVNQKT